MASSSTHKGTKAKKVVDVRIVVAGIILITVLLVGGVILSFLPKKEGRKSDQGYFPPKKSIVTTQDPFALPKEGGVRTFVIGVGESIPVETPICTKSFFDISHPVEVINSKGKSLTMLPKNANLGLAKHLGTDKRCTLANPNAEEMEVTITVTRTCTKT